MTTTTIDTVSSEQLEAWSQHPMVTTAVSRCGPDYGAAELLFSLHEIMTEMEARFPSVPFGEILACHDPGSVPNRQRIQTRLLEAGVQLADVELLVGAVPTDGIGEPEYELALANISFRDLVEKYGRTETSAGHIRSLRQPITRIEQKVIDLFDNDPGISRAEAARCLGVTLGTIRKALRKGRYQLWLERKQAVAA